jgi:hypothetical protein
VQEAAPASEPVEVPGEQASQAVALEAAEKRPALHGTQKERSDEPLKVPGGQIWQPFRSLVRPLPGGQVPHCMWSSEAG